MPALFKSGQWNFQDNAPVHNSILLTDYLTKMGVEKKKISYFGLALNLFQHLISPNEDDLSYSARTFISS